MWRRCPFDEGGRRRGGAVGFLLLLFGVLVRGGYGGYGAGSHGVVGSCAFRVCWWVCGRGAVAASKCLMAGRTSKSSFHGQWAAAHVLSGEAGGQCGCDVTGRCTSEVGDA